MSIWNHISVGMRCMYCSYAPIASKLFRDGPKPCPNCGATLRGMVTGKTTTRDLARRAISNDYEIELKFVPRDVPWRRKTP